MRSRSTQEIPDEAPGGHGPRSLLRLLMLFDCLSRGPAEGLPLARLCEVLATPKSSLLNLLRPLVASSRLQHAHGRYRLGPTMYLRTAAWLSARRFPQGVRPFMQELSQQVGETVVLGVLDEEAGATTYVEVLPGPGSVRYAVEPGCARPLHAAAIGRVLVAFTDDRSRRRYLESARLRVQLPDSGDRSRLASELRTVRREGICFSADHLLSGLAGVAAPIFDRPGRCVAAIGVAGSTQRFHREGDAIRAAVRQAALRASGLQPGTTLDAAGGLS
jgi:IclR family transcriptional regulator, acetate operon repressor